MFQSFQKSLNRQVPFRRINRLDDVSWPLCAGGLACRAQRWRACRQASAGACEGGVGWGGVGLGMVFRGTENSFCMAETNGEPGLVVRTGG